MTFEATAAAVTISLGNGINYTCTKVTPPTDGSAYSYTCFDGRMIKGTLELLTDGTFVMTAGGGPASNLSWRGTWLVDGATISIAFAK